jgi:chemotaxis-related protein WspD
MENDLNTLSISRDNKTDIPILNDCWNHIGVMGDRSCSELKDIIHCRNCAVYSAAGRSLLERPAPPEYLKEWTEVLAETSTQQLATGEGTIIGANDTISVIIFRLGHERLALPVSILQEISPQCTIHTVPHRSDKIFLGIINIRGETLLCASLRNLLNLEPLADTTLFNSTSSTKRMIVTGQNENKWVFPVDEVHGIYRFQLNELKDAPVVIAKASEAYTKGVVTWQGKKINYLNYDLIFYSLNRNSF